MAEDIIAQLLARNAQQAAITAQNSATEKAGEAAGSASAAAGSAAAASGSASAAAGFAGNASGSAAAASGSATTAGTAAATATTQAGIATASATSAGISQQAALAAANATGTLYTPTSVGAAPPYKVSAINIGAAGTATGTGRFAGGTSGLTGFSWTYQATPGSGISAPMWPEKTALSTSSTPPTLTATNGGVSGATATATMAQLQNGDTFLAPSADYKQLLLWQVSGGVVAAVVDGNGMQYGQPLATSVLPFVGTATIAPAGTAASGSNAGTDGKVWYWPDTIKPYDQWIDTLSIAFSAAGSYKIIVASVNGDGTLNSVSTSATRTATVGVNTATSLQIYVPAGAVIGVQLISGNWYYAAGSFGGTQWTTTTIPTTNTAKSIGTTNGIKWGVTLLAETVYKARYGFALATSNASTLAIAVVSLGGTVTVGSTTPVASGTASPAYTVAPNAPAPAAGYVTGFTIGLASAQSVSLLILSLAGNVATIVSTTVFSLSSGLQTVSGLQIPIATGQIAALSATGIYYNTSDGQSIYYKASALNSGDTLTGPVTNFFRFECNVTMITGVSAQASVALAQSTATAAAVGASTQQGFIPATDGTGTADAATTWFSATRFAQSGTLSVVSLWSATAGPAVLFTANISGSSVTIVSQQNVTFSAGLNTFTNFNPSVTAGQILGLYTASGSIRYASGGGTCLKYVGQASGTVTVSPAGVGLRLGWQIDSGVFRTLQTLSQGVGAPTSGIGLLASADSSGGSDSATVFASARLQHPTPCVPTGTFTLSSIPNNGDGFWGTGRVSVNGVTISLPVQPELGARFLKLRSALVSQIYSGSALIINGDSITNGLQASSPQTNYVGLITRFANMGIALDEAVLSNFDTTDTSGGPAFHGLTFASPSTVSNGTGGPLQTSLLLQPGQSMSFAGAYERVDVTYTGVSGGTLVFAYGGATYATVNTTASGNDLLAGAGATGQTASSTYSITNTGSVAVEITSLMRFGVKASGSPPRLYVCRFAHGNYRFTNYGAAQIASMMRIATAIAGGTNHFLVPALGTNDSIGGVAYATLKANVTSYVNAWVSAGIPVSQMLPIMPWRWTSYGGGGSIEQGNAAIRDAYRSFGIGRFVQTDGFDMVAQGYGPHPNDAGFLLEFNALVSAFCAGTI